MVAFGENAYPVYKCGDNVLMVITEYGQGRVFAISNEKYLQGFDGRCYNLHT